MSVCALLPGGTQPVLTTQVPDTVLHWYKESNLIIVRLLLTEILSEDFGIIYCIKLTILFHSRIKSRVHKNGIEIFLTVKVKLSLCLINKALCHEDVWGREGIAPPFLALALDGGE
jgi:uncharacterized protein YacL